MKLPDSLTEGLPTVAPGALLILNRAELCAHLSPGLKGMEANQAWRDFAARIDRDQPQPALN